MIEALIIAAVTGAASGLISWGGVRVELRWLRRDVDRAHSRLDELDERKRQRRREGDALSTLKRS